MKTIFITGVSSGLGKATAQLFAARGWKVIATMRRPAAETDLAGLDNVVLLPLDVTSPTQIAQTVSVAIELGEIDVVFNDAGYGLTGPLSAGSDDVLLRLIDMNLLGVIRVTKAFIPYFKNRGRGLFISTTAIGELMGLSYSMAFELKRFGIGIKTIAPGAIRTDLAGRSTDRSTDAAYQEPLQKVMDFLGSAFSTSSAEAIASVVYAAATDGKEQLRYVAGEDAMALYTRQLEQGSEAF